MGSEKFCLRWNEFEKNISGAFRELRDDKDFFDVTIACDDEQIQAHKVILSACSPFFRSVLRRNPHQHPLLYLKGVRYSDLQYVLDFMYQGEVSVAQEELNSFLAVAEDLKVKGLTQSQSPVRGQVKSKDVKIPQRVNEKEIFQSNINAHSPAPSHRIINQSSHYPTDFSVEAFNTTHEEDIQEIVPVKSEPKDLPAKPMTLATAPQDHYPSSQTGCHSLAPAEDEQYIPYEDYGQCGDDQGYYYSGTGGQQGGAEQSEGHKEQIETSILISEENGATFYKCSLCGKTTQRKDALKTHVENIHFPGSYACQYCDQVFTSKVTRNVHVGRKHKFN